MVKMKMMWISKAIKSKQNFSFYICFFLFFVSLLDFLPSATSKSEWTFEDIRIEKIILAPI